MAAVIELLSWLALPIGLWCALDSWFLHPRRVLAGAREPALVTVAYYALPIVCVAVIWRLLTAQTLDFSVVLFGISLVTGVIWALDALFFRKRRAAAAAAAGRNVADLPEPGTIDYARSFFPVAVLVLVVRGFLFEPFRIPSDSMMPTLLAGDFIVVSKYSYGLRWPVLNRKFVDVSEPQRGDVIVFRYPPDPRINYIKRLVGLPGDRVQVISDRLIINGAEVPFQETGVYDDGCYTNLRTATEKLGEHEHRVLFCPSPDGLSRSLAPGCNRDLPDGHWSCENTAIFGNRDRGDIDTVVPAGHYLMIGDNRDNSEDGRFWGFVPEANLVGKATRVWFNFDTGRSDWLNWRRIGQRID